MVCGALLAPFAGGSSPELPDGWQSRQAPGITIHYRPDNATLAAGLQRDGPAIRDRVALLLGPEAGVPVQVILLPASGRHADEVAPRAPDWAAGFTVPGSGVLFIRVGTLGVYPDRDLASVFAHELGHAVFGNLSRNRGLPRWFEEGSCMLVARPWDLGDSFRLSVAVVFHGRAPLTSYETGFPRDAALDNTLFIECSRSGITEETVKLHEFTPRDASRIVFANKGPLRELAERDHNLALTLPEERPGRFGRNTTPILLAPMHVAGLDTPVAYAPLLEDTILPQKEWIERAIGDLTAY